MWKVNIRKKSWKAAEPERSHWGSTCRGRFSLLSEVWILGKNQELLENAHVQLSQRSARITIYRSIYFSQYPAKVISNCKKSTQLSVKKHPLSYYRREVNFQRSLPLMSRHKFSIRVLAVDKFSNLPTQPKILGYFSLEAHQQSCKDIRESIGALKNY